MSCKPFTIFYLGILFEYCYNIFLRGDLYLMDKVDVIGSCFSVSTLQLVSPLSLLSLILEVGYATSAQVLPVVNKAEGLFHRSYRLCSRFDTV